LAIDGPLEYVKEALKVGSYGARELVLILGLVVMISPTKATFPLLRRVLIA